MRRRAYWSIATVLGLAALIGLTPAQQQRKLVWMSHPVHLSVLDNGKLLEEFTRKTGIVVEVITTSEPQVRVPTELASGSSSIDVISVNDAYWTTTLANFFEPLDAYIKNSPVPGSFEDFSKGMVRQFRVPQTDNGATYAVPFRMNVDILFYRKDLFEKYRLKVPKTLDEYYRTATQLKAALTRDGVTDMFPAVFQGAQSQYGVWDWYDWASPLGVDLMIGPDWKRAAFNTPQAVRALNMRRRFITEGLVSPGVLNFAFDDAINAIGQEKAAMTIMTMAYWARLENPQTSKAAGKLGYAAAPRDPKVDSPYFVRGWGAAINKNSRNKDAAWELIKWLTAPEQQQDMAKFGNPASRLSVMQSAEYRTKIPTAPAEAESLARAKIQPNNPKLVQVVDILAKYINAALRGSMTASDALAQAEREANAVLR